MVGCMVRHRALALLQSAVAVVGMHLNVVEAQLAFVAHVRVPTGGGL
jgi:hypothetical protein